MLRARHSDAQCGEGEQEERQRNKAAPEAAADHAGEHVDIREPDRILHPAALGEHVQRDRERNHEQRQQEDRPLEAHDPPPQSAPTWTTARTPCTAAPACTRTSTRLPRTVRFVRTLSINDWPGACRV